MSSDHIRAMLIGSFLSMAAATCMSTLAMAQDLPGYSAVQIQRNAGKPTILVQGPSGDPCSCRFQYDGCRVPCTYSQGAAAQKGCIDRCVRQLQACRQACR